MSIALTEPMAGLTEGTTLRFAKLTRIEREDGQFLYLTDHDKAITFEDEVGARKYLPAGSFEGSSRMKEAGIEPVDVEFVGAVSSDAITNDDIRAGLYRNAKVIETIVDWKFPFGGKFERTVFWVQDTEHDEEKWTFHVVGIAALLQQKVGMVAGRTCKNKLGDSLCTVDLQPHTSYGVDITAVTEQRLVFQVSLSDLVTYPSPYKNYLQFGEITWESGANAGVVSEIKADERDSVDTSKVNITLFLPTPFDMDDGGGGDGDYMTIVPGCNKLHTGDDGTSGHCVNKFSNGPNFRGFKFVPGRDRLLKRSRRS